MDDAAGVQDAVDHRGVLGRCAADIDERALGEGAPGEPVGGRREQRRHTGPDRGLRNGGEVRGVVGGDRVGQTVRQQGSGVDVLEQCRVGAAEVPEDRGDTEGRAEGTEVLAAGDFDLLASVVAADLPALGRSVHGLIGGLKGVRSTRTRPGITLYSEGGDWRMRAMEPSGHAELSTPRASRPTVYSAHMHHRPPPGDRALLEALGRDGRLGYTDLGAATGMSEHTARRRLQRMIRDRDITFRCDLAHPVAGLSTVVLYRAAVPHTHLEGTGNALARMEEVRLAVSISGSDNLLVMVRLRGLHAIDPFEAHLAERFPNLTVNDRTVFLHSRKRMGRLLDATGRAIGHVPFSLPQV